MFVDPRLHEVRSIIRPEVPIPTILQTEEPPSKARAREVESIGALPFWAGEIVPNLGADVPNDRFSDLFDLGITEAVWLDAPQYAHATQLATPEQRSRFTPLVSSPQALKERLRNRRNRSTPPEVSDNPGVKHPRSYLGAQGPVELTSEATLLTQADSRAFLNGDLLADEDLNGDGTTVAVLDTGINPEHPMLEGQVTEHLSMVAEEPGSDLQGHGTWCGGMVAGNPVEYTGLVEALNGEIVQGMAPGADLIDVKVLTGEGTGSTSGVIQGIEAAIERGVDILSMSLGSLFGMAGQGPDAAAVNEAARRGVIPVIAAGNSFAFGTVGSPGSAAGSVTVASVSQKAPQPNIVSTFSSKGPTSAGRIKPDIAAPGGNLGLGAPALDETILGPTSGQIATDSDEPWGLLRGTSMATPAVSGLFAQLLPAGLPRDREALEHLFPQSTRGSPTPAKNNRTGWGLLDGRELLQRAQGDNAQPIRGLAVDAHTRPRLLTGALTRAASRINRVPGPDPFTTRLPLV